MSDYRVSDEYNDKVYLDYLEQRGTAHRLERELRIAVRFLSDEQLKAVREEVRLEELLEAYPPTVEPAFKRLNEIHDETHPETCKCIEYAKLERQHQLALDSV